MAINYTCHLCRHEYEAISDEFLEEIKRDLKASQGDMPRHVLFECPNCKSNYPLHIPDLLSEGE